MSHRRHRCTVAAPFALLFDDCFLLSRVHRSHRRRVFTCALARSHACMHTHMHAHTDMHKRTQARARTHTGPQKRKDNAKKERDYRAEAAAKLTILYAGAQARPRGRAAGRVGGRGGREGGRAGGREGREGGRPGEGREGRKEGGMKKREYYRHRISRILLDVP